MAVGRATANTKKRQPRKKQGGEDGEKEEKAGALIKLMPRISDIEATGTFSKKFPATVDEAIEEHWKSINTLESLYKQLVNPRLKAAGMRLKGQDLKRFKQEKDRRRDAVYQAQLKAYDRMYRVVDSVNGKAARRCGVDETGCPKMLSAVLVSQCVKTAPAIKVQGARLGSGDTPAGLRKCRKQVKKAAAKRSKRVDTVRGTHTWFSDDDDDDNDDDDDDDDDDDGDYQRARDIADTDAVSDADAEDLFDLGGGNLTRDQKLRIPNWDEDRSGGGGVRLPSKGRLGARRKSNPASSPGSQSPRNIDKAPVVNPRDPDETHEEIRARALALQANKGRVDPDTW